MYTYIFPLLIEYCIGKFLDRLGTVMHWTIGTNFFLDIMSQSEIFATLVTSCNAGAIINISGATKVVCEKGENIYIYEI